MSDPVGTATCAVGVLAGTPPGVGCAGAIGVIRGWAGCPDLILARCMSEVAQRNETVVWPVDVPAVLI